MRKNILLLIFTILLFFSSIELYTRVKTYLKNHDEKFLFYGGSDIELIVKKAVYKLKEFKDAKGRQPSYLIAAFGGSTTAGHTVDPELTYPAQLEKKLAARYNVKVINCGVGGMKCKGIYASFLDRLAHLKGMPQTVIFHTGLNDAGGYTIKSGKITYADQDYVNPDFFLRLDMTL
ncbi:MAG: SGNH/GDSL hydrolase family protein, partial [Candidatus Omnitrophica bacterium]|nr:SGNH/GDSL hydrolase family protein [Candidatus Omnitrophota bacterium]